MQRWNGSHSAVGHSFVQGGVGTGEHPPVSKWVSAAKRMESVDVLSVLEYRATSAARRTCPARDPALHRRFADRDPDHAFLAITCTTDASPVWNWPSQTMRNRLA